MRSLALLSNWIAWSYDSSLRRTCDLARRAGTDWGFNSSAAEQCWLARSDFLMAA